MKKIYVLRHSKSSWKDLSLGDFHRPLNSRGKIDGSLISAYLRSRIDEIDFLHCSNSVRTYETSKFFIERIKYTDIEYDESLYHSSSSEIINKIKHYDEQYNSAMIIAHNPGLTNLVNELSDHILDNLPTTGLVEINFNCSVFSYAETPIILNFSRFFRIKFKVEVPIEPVAPNKIIFL